MQEMQKLMVMKERLKQYRRKKKREEMKSCLPATIRQGRRRAADEAEQQTRTENLPGRKGIEIQN